jgi:hypothetical protein
MKLRCKRAFSIGGLPILQVGILYEVEEYQGIQGNKNWRLYKWKVITKHPAVPFHASDDEDLYKYFYTAAEDRKHKIQNLNEDADN